MQHVLGTTLRNNRAEIIDDDALGKESYTLLGLFAAVEEAKRRIENNRDILKINVYEVFDGVKRMTLGGSKYQLVYKVGTDRE